MVKYLLAACVLMLTLLPGTSFAQVIATKISDDARGYTYRMCTAEDTTGVCNNGTGDIYVKADGLNDFAFFFTETAAGNSCNVYALPAGALVTDLDTLITGGFKVNGTQLTVSNPVQWFQIRAKHIFVHCTRVAGTYTVDVMMAETATQRGN